MDPIVERFIDVWGSPERGQRLWNEWRAAMGDNAQIIDDMAQIEAEQRNIPIEEAQCRMAIEKFAADRGYDYVKKMLHQHEAEQLRGSRTLQPMAPANRKKR